jgi:hypothetical protein
MIHQPVYPAIANHTIAAQPEQKNIKRRARCAPPAARENKANDGINPNQVSRSPSPKKKKKSI